MRFLYALAAVVLLSSSALAQRGMPQGNQTDFSALKVTGSPDITTVIYNFTPTLPPAYFPYPPFVAGNAMTTFYIAPTFFQRVEANGDTVGTGTPIIGAGVTAAGIVALNPNATNGSGLSEACVAADVSNLSALAGKVVMIARGTCSFYIKFQVAEAAGAIGVVVFNPAYRTASDPQNLTGGLGGTPLAGEPNIGIPGVIVPVGIAQPIIDEIVGGGAVTLQIAEESAVVVAAEPGVATTNSSFELRGANPFSGQTAFRVTTENTEEVRVELYNVRGQKVATLFEGVVAGERMVQVSSANLAAGVYFVRATGASFRFQEQVTVIR